MCASQIYSQHFIISKFFNCLLAYFSYKWIYRAKSGGMVANVKYPVWPGIVNGACAVTNFFCSRCVFKSLESSSDFCVNSQTAINQKFDLLQMFCLALPLFWGNPNPTRLWVWFWHNLRPVIFPWFEFQRIHSVPMSHSNAVPVRCTVKMNRSVHLKSHKIRK